ncbi:MAG: GNAT family N-acetyltransferase [Acutalibacteraceae bacterium]|jgi:predicted dehydrogenase/GNAT superfamily N-acetyltransferase
MEQLKMYWLAGTPIKQYEFPEGYSVSNYKDESDKQAWYECCRNGLVTDGETEAFKKDIEAVADINPYEDVFFLDYEGEHIGTVTAFLQSKDNNGNMHMAAIREDFRGKGLAKYLAMIALNHLSAKGVKYVLLTTDEFRESAIKSYLKAGFLPVEYSIAMQDRWEQVLENCGIESALMLYEDASEYKTVYRRSKAAKIKIGVLGAGRGRSMMDYCMVAGNAGLVAVCDFRKDKLDAAEKEYGAEGISYYTDFDEFLKHDMDCVVLANYANEHAPFALKCFEAGKNVLSEVLPVQTMKEAVELVEAIERTGKQYIFAENCAFMPAIRKMRELYLKGDLGDFEYGEGEYLHNCESDWHHLTYGDPNHWRNTMSAFYYCTHSIGPFIHISGLRPVKVTGFEAPFNARMARMGAKAGPFGVEMITLENGAILKSVHGVGISKNSLWFSVYGSKGRMESAREDAGIEGGFGNLYVNLDKEEGDNSFEPVLIKVKDPLSEMLGDSGHGNADYYLMHQLVEKLRGNRNADVVDVYEALDMFLPGMFAYFSVLEGGAPMDIPDLRNPAERDRWRNDTRCTDPAVAGDMLIDSYSKGNPEIPTSVYERHAAQLKKEYEAAKAKAEQEN